MGMWIELSKEVVESQESSDPTELLTRPDILLTGIKLAKVKG